MNCAAAMRWREARGGRREARRGAAGVEASEQRTDARLATRLLRRRAVAKDGACVVRGLQMTDWRLMCDDLPLVT